MKAQNRFNYLSLSITFRILCHYLVHMVIQFIMVLLCERKALFSRHANQSSLINKSVFPSGSLSHAKMIDPVGKVAPSSQPACRNNTSSLDLPQF